MAGYFCKQTLKTQADLRPQQKFKFLSGPQPEAKVRISQTVKVCNQWIPSVFYNTTQKNLEALS